MKTAKGHINLHRVIPVFKKEFLHILRDSRSLAVVLIGPAFMLFLYGYAVTFDIKKVELGVVDYSCTTLSRELVAKLTASGYFELYKEKTENDSMGNYINALRVNKIKMIMTIPESFSADIKKNRKTKIQLIADGSDANTANVAMGYAKMIIAGFSQSILLDAVRKKGLNPKKIPFIETVPRVWYNPEMKSTNFIVPGLISIIMMLLSALLTSLTVVREKEKGTFEQLISTPIKPVELLVGKILPYVVICLCDVVIIVLVGTLWFKVPFRGDFATLTLFSLLFVFCALGLGMFISSIAKDQQTAVIVTVFTTVLPSVLLSGFIFPIDSMPPAIRIFTYVVPARYFLTALRSIFLKAGVGIDVLWIEALYLFIFGMLFMVISTRKFKKHLG